MFTNYQQNAQGSTLQPEAPSVSGQQRPGTAGHATQPSTVPGTSTSQQQMLQQVLQQNPHLAAQMQQRLQPANMQVIKLRWLCIPALQ